MNYSDKNLPNKNLPSHPELNSQTHSFTESHLPATDLPSDEFKNFLRNETFGGIVLILAATAGIIWANLPGSVHYFSLRDTIIGIDVLHLRMPLSEWTSSGILAFFFFVVGLELKRELVVDNLSNKRTALLPIIAACGGVLVPGVIVALIAWGTADISKSWAIPTATDIAFALGILALLQSRVPASARTFLLALAVVDDLIAIIIIALLFTDSINWYAALAVLAGLACYFYAQRQGIRSIFIYLPLAIFVWIALHSMGIHPTIAGVALGLLTRVQPHPKDKPNSEPLGISLEHRLQPYSALVAVPIFAFFAAGISLSGQTLKAMFTDQLTLGIIVALVLGKVIGIVGASLSAIKLGIATRPEGIRLKDMLALGMLGGIGFTVSLLIAELSLTGQAADYAKGGVLVGSIVAAILAAVLLMSPNRPKNTRTSQ